MLMSFFMSRECMAVSPAEWTVSTLTQESSLLLLDKTHSVVLPLNFSAVLHIHMEDKLCMRPCCLRNSSRSQPEDCNSPPHDPEEYKCCAAFPRLPKCGILVLTQYYSPFSTQSSKRCL